MLDQQPEDGEACGLRERCEAEIAWPSDSEPPAGTVLAWLATASMDFDRNFLGPDHRFHRH